MPTRHDWREILTIIKVRYTPVMKWPLSRVKRKNHHKLVTVQPWRRKIEISSQGHAFAWASLVAVLNSLRSSSLSTDGSQQSFWGYFYFSAVYCNKNILHSNFEMQNQNSASSLFCFFVIYFLYYPIFDSWNDINRAESLCLSRFARFFCVSKKCCMEIHYEKFLKFFLMFDLFRNFFNLFIQIFRLIIFFVQSKTNHRI